MKHIAVSLLVALWAAAAFAQEPAFETGDSLLAKCRIALSGMDAGAGDMRDAVNAGICVGYVLAVADATSGAAPRPRGKACIPRGAAREQLVRIVTTYLTRDPEALNAPASDAVNKAYVAAFPC
jgi:Rap1a immunity proteins